MKVVLVVALVCNFLFANEYLESIYENIVLNNSKNTIVSIEKLQEDIKKGNLENIKSDFSEVVKAWKSVEAFYILGDLNDAYLDTPRYLDTFHHGNEDIKIQLDRIIADNEDLSISLYKNSHKTINALEYILFTKDLTNKRVKDIALAITVKMGEHFQDIYNGYKNEKAKFLQDEQSANAVMLNALIENSYKLKEWRIGDASGLSRKYKGKPDNRRAEYALSKNSQRAIKAILDTHLQVLGETEFKNYGALIKSYEISSELEDSIKYLNGTLEQLHLINEDDFSNAKALYTQAQKLHTAYYVSLIGKLEITAKVLDADGD